MKMQIEWLLGKKKWSYSVKNESEMDRRDEKVERPKVWGERAERDRRWNGKTTRDRESFTSEQTFLWNYKSLPITVHKAA